MTPETIRLGDGEVAAQRAGPAPDADAHGTLVLLHANGLNKGAYEPMAETLAQRRHVVLLDARGHGATRLPAPPGAMRSWGLYADDLTRVLARLRPAPPVTLVGHSMGAVAALLAAAGGAPAARLVLIEPVLVPDLFRWLARSPAAALLPRLLPIARRAARRRARFESTEAVSGAYARSAFFGAWDAEAREGYIRDGVTADGAGQGVRLTCDPAWEAASFAGQAHGFWGPLRRVCERGVPVHVLRAQTHSTVPAQAIPRLVRTGAQVTQMQGDHLLPQTRPEAVAAFVRLALREGGVS